MNAPVSASDTKRSTSRTRPHPRVRRPAQRRAGNPCPSAACQRSIAPRRRSRLVPLAAVVRHAFNKTSSPLYGRSRPRKRTTGPSTRGTRRQGPGTIRSAHAASRRSQRAPPMAAAHHAESRGPARFARPSSPAQSPPAVLGVHDHRVHPLVQPTLRRQLTPTRLARQHVVRSQHQLRARAASAGAPVGADGHLRAASSAIGSGHVRRARRAAVAQHVRHVLRRLQRQAHSRARADAAPPVRQAVE